MKRDPRPADGLFGKPRILRPSLGRPVFIGAGAPTFGAIIASPWGRPGAAALRGGFRLVPVRAPGPPVLLDVVSVGPSAAWPKDVPLRRFIGPEAAGRLYEVRMEVPAEPDPGGRRFTLFDLVHPDLAPGLHAVVWIDHAWERQSFAFVPDIHLGEVWDGISSDIAKLPSLAREAGDRGADRLGRLFSRQAFAASFVNPNGQWRDFVREANRRADRGTLDLVVLGGDLVEYQLPANFDLFVDSVTGAAPGTEPLGVPLLTVPGNHDYRLYPYRPQIYPLDRFGLHDLQRDRFFRIARGERRSRLAPRDLRAVLHGDGGRHPLAEYFLKIDAQPDDTLTLGRTTFVLLDTGRDVFRDFKRARPSRWGNVLRALRHVWLFPGSAGLRDDQAVRLTREADEGTSPNLVVVFHAGLTAGPDGGRPNLFGRGFLTAGDSLRGRIKLEKALARTGFSRGGLFQNQLALFRAAAAAGRNVLGLSGHFHRPVAVKFDKASATLGFKDPPDGEIAAADFGTGSYFIGGAALGLIEPRSNPGGQPGFTRVEISGDRIVSVRGEAFPPPGRPALEVRAHRGESPGDPVVLTVTLAPAGPVAGPDRSVGDVVFIVFVRPRRGVPGAFPYCIEELTPAGVRTGAPRWVDPAGRKDYFGSSRPVFIQAFRGGFGATRRFRFEPTGPSKRKAKAIIAVEIPGRDGGAESTIIWHPLSIDVGAGARRRSP